MINRSDCEQAVLEAISLANKRYAKWSGGLWLNDAGVEAMVCHALAEKLNSTFPDYFVQLETSYRWLFEQSGVKRRPGRPIDLVRGTARADVALLNRDRQPVYLFEIKRTWNAYSAWSDGCRLCEAITLFGTHNGGSLEGGAFGVFNVRKPKARQTSEEVAAAQADIMRELEAWDVEIEHLQGKLTHGGSDEGEWSCHGVCFSFKGKPPKRRAI